ncbi:MAG: hypothetical protein AUJ07_00525 [Crenarchaeota archaeon 13_1_40CM_3_53_5]|nr:MAG: hypothetical protein AUJ07_00525 [Crenarchaeota archaeon 13_1_40CM_3_53_5]
MDNENGFVSRISCSLARRGVRLRQEGYLFLSEKRVYYGLSSAIRDRKRHEMRDVPQTPIGCEPDPSTKVKNKMRNPFRRKPKKTSDSETAKQA